MDKKSLITAMLFAVAAAIVITPSASAAIIHDVNTDSGSINNLTPAVVDNDLLQTNLSSSSIEGFTPSAYDPSLPDGGNLYDGLGNTSTVSGGEAYIDGSLDDPWTVTFTLDTSVNTSGYDLTAINVFSAWNSVLASQNFTLEVSLVGSSDFTTLGTFVQAADDVAMVSHLYEDASGILASGVDVVRFTHNSNGTRDGRGSYREIDVIGTATIPEPATLTLACTGLLMVVAKRRR